MQELPPEETDTEHDRTIDDTEVVAPHTLLRRKLDRAEWDEVVSETEAWIDTLAKASEESGDKTVPRPNTGRAAQARHRAKARGDLHTSKRKARRQARVVEFRRVQSLFVEDRPRLAKEILDGVKDVKSQIPIAEIEDHFQKIMGGDGDTNPITIPEVYPMPPKANTKGLMRKVTAKEVKKILKTSKLKS